MTIRVELWRMLPYVLSASRYFRRAPKMEHSDENSRKGTEWHRDIARAFQCQFGKLADWNSVMSMGEARDRMITVQEFAAMAGISRRQIDRLRTRRPDGFPREFELGSRSSKFRRCPRFRISEVRAWLDSRALW